MSIQRPNVLIMGAPNQGKAQPLHCYIQSPDSSHLTFRSVKVGDRIYGEDSKIYKVEQVHEQGLLDAYNIEFDDGSRTSCCKDHLWVFTLNNVEQTMTLEEFMYDKAIVRNAEFPLTLPVVNLKANLPLSPKLLALLLADKSSATVSNHSVVINREVAAIEHDIIEEFPDMEITAIGDRRTIAMKSTTFMEAVHSLNLQLNPSIGRVPKYKHIPDIYLRASISQRESLFTHMFTDNTYETKSENLVISAIKLANSLGYKVYNKTLSDDGVFTIKVNREPRKIRKITSVGKLPMRCISTSNPTSLYLTDDYIVTHNTYSMKELASDPVAAKKVLYIGADRLIVCFRK